jgi:Domain of unknown function (DUF6457)
VKQRPAAKNRRVNEWLAQVRDALADAAGVPTAELELDDATTRELLDLARIAAHVGGERTNAPLLCYLIGRASTRATVDVLAEAVRSAARTP